MLSKLRTDALVLAGPVKATNLQINLQKLIVEATTDLNSIISGIPAALEAKYTGPTLLVGKAELSASFTRYKSAVTTDYKNSWTSSDPACVPAGSQDLLEAAFAQARPTLDEKYARAWRDWVLNISSTSITTLRGTLDKAVTTIKAGDTVSWDSTAASAKEAALDAFNAPFRSQYSGPNPDAVQKDCVNEVENTIKTRQSIWLKNDAEVKDAIARKLAAAKQTYSNRLSTSLRPNEQPPDFNTTVDATPERVRIVPSFI